MKTLAPRIAPGRHRLVIHGMGEPDSVPVPLTRVPGLLESLGLARPSVQACHRWARRGRCGVKLASSCPDGHKLYTTLAAVRAFVLEAKLS